MRWMGCICLVLAIGVGLDAGEVVVERAAVTVHVDAPVALAAMTTRPMYCETLTKPDQAVANLRALAPYAVISAQLLAQEEAALQARAREDKKSSPKLTLPSDIHRPSPVARSRRRRGIPNGRGSRFHRHAADRSV